MPVPVYSMCATDCLSLFLNGSRPIDCCLVFLYVVVQIIICPLQKKTALSFHALGPVSTFFIIQGVFICAVTAQVLQPLTYSRLFTQQNGNDK